ncbi:ABC transporter permease subunit/CPBP intramembrane protease [Stieleria varia]|uniref:ABC-2 family transporter protein n=1 Tax=Stieleria varia TaxID=2528005 RepID=A0A5C6B781_9BACT|nr:ABC transporter permease subunit/CPBP intramembrane protease [Stieleria varia]TWU07848.1 ABC-2 family transporter protein [Stieleria varia]
MSKSVRHKRVIDRAGDKPRWSAIWLIYMREMRDQLRDRRTLFTIAVLPIMLYPLVGMLLLQIAQFSRQHPTSVCIVGTEHLSNVPPLIDGEEFSGDLSKHSETLQMISYRWDEWPDTLALDEQATAWVRSGQFDVVTIIPPGFADETKRNEDPEAAIELLYNVGSDQSMVARDRVTRVLSDWRGGWVRDDLSEAGVNLKMLEPFHLNDRDIAPERTREAAFWSKLLPFIMLVWAMTGAFYPAIDLVAGEKERGTLETLLCSPALRSEIVWGKLAAVTTFSMLTALLNAGSMLLTSGFVFKQMGVGMAAGSFGAPPLLPMLWLFVALVPLSALFSALALAVAAMARSSKEGQYYLMPLMMVTLPLVMLPMLPGTTLNVGTSLIPVTGMFLMVRSLVEGQYANALFYLPMVATVTAVCLSLAARWARRQFEDESVLFGGGEQWELSMWVRHLWRDRQMAATPAQAYACGAIILVTLFFARLAVTEMPQSFAGIAKMVMLPQVLIVFPALLMATMLTTSIRKSLRIRMPHWTTVPLAVLLGLTLHPSYVMLAQCISYLYPVSEQTAVAMKPFAEQIASAPWMSVVLLMAAVPAICEELAFRGFVFGGLVREKGRLRAVVVTAVMFGISHGVLQQSIAATIMGLMLGWVALKTGSVLPGILIHFTNNALSVSMERIAETQSPISTLLLVTGEAGTTYHPMWIVTSIGIAATCLLYFGTLRVADEGKAADLIQEHDELLDPSSPLTATA